MQQSPADRSIIDKRINHVGLPNRSNLLKQINYLHIMNETYENRIVVKCTQNFSWDFAIVHLIRYLYYYYYYS